ncbi:hypothetical protein TI39_contig438g00008 [Zymoseptoria brevis]|uniref:Uncharacterized protein n=1 Tax=Zymoseptoria brevis TaxID=1047168 RepID=A0A0F4GLH2_9PEZI|nr:hypothetical protein TI39_contig438g00008 [Zymoseptoria brevis]
MPLLRASSLRSFQTALRFTTTRATARAAAPARTQLVAKRFNSSGGSGGHGHGEPSSDLPWLLTALVVTPPAAWYLWPEESHDSGHHGDHDSHGDDHAEKADEGEEEAPAEEEKSEEKGDESEKSEENSEDKEEKSEEKSEEKEKKSEEKEEKSEEKEEKSEEKEEKSEDKKEDKSSDDKSDEKSDEKKDLKDKIAEKDEAKTAEKKQGEDSTTSDKAMKLGEGAIAATSASKPKGKSQGDITVKQGGMSNTDTKHSTKIGAGSEKSTKGDGNPETAKSKGTIDPNAPVK